MPGATSVYGLPYLEPDDAPDIPGISQSISEAVETQLVRVDAPVPMAQLRQTVAQTVTTGTWAVVTFTTEDIDNRDGHSNSSNTSRYTAQVAGTYELSGAVCFSSTSLGSMWSRWAKNGTDIAGSGTNMINTTSQALLPARTILVTLAVGDYVELQAEQFSGGNLATYVASAYAQSTMTVKWVSP